jgi:hypothetical protein
MSQSVEQYHPPRFQYNGRVMHLNLHLRETGRSNQHQSNSDRCFAGHGLRGYRAFRGEADYSRNKETVPYIIYYDTIARIEPSYQKIV